MYNILKFLVITTASTLAAGNSSSQSAGDIRASSSSSAIAKPAPVTPAVHPSLTALPPLDRGVFIRPLAEISLLGKGHFEVLPRISHINITVDDEPRREMIIMYSLAPGPHKVLIELTDPAQNVIASETVEFTLPDPRDLLRAGTAGRVPAPLK